MTEAPTIAENEKKRLAVFLDGTWNAVSDNTNVWRLKALCAPKSSDGVVQLPYYSIGVNGFLGGGFGKGLSENVTQAYEWLIDHYSSGDEIFIFGFSRGAYTARSLAGLIAMHGLLKAGAPLGVNQLYERYKRTSARTIWKLGELNTSGSLADATNEEEWVLKYSQPIEIKVIGVWDTVGALGIPWLSLEGISRASFGFHHTGLRVSIENAFHALAIDEHRGDFAPTLWTIHRGPDGNWAAPRSLSRVEQRWFVGAHANVGGGYNDNLLGQIPLRWMMKKASLHGLEFKNDVEIDGDVLKAGIAPSYEEFMRGVYCKVKRRHYRPIGAEPERKGEDTYSTINETIDASVFERWREVPQYRPQNLAEWAARRNVDMNALNQSVRADDPMAPAPD